MKKLIVLVVLLSVSVLNAAIITVDNNSPSAGDYSTLQEAHDAANSGDIIYVFPSNKIYNAITVTKPLQLFGVGFNLLETIGEPYTPTASITGTMTFEIGAAGSILEGFDGSFWIFIKCTNVTIKRNDVMFISVYADACSFLQNNITNNSGACLELNKTMNHIFLNNLIRSFSAFCIHGNLMSTNLTFTNNVIIAAQQPIVDIQESIFTNNIFSGSYFQSCYNNIYLYNMSNSNQLPEGNGNLINVDVYTVFVDLNNDDYHLQPNSPASGTGENGTDMGIYGGDAPYVDGGFPGLPSILQIQAPIIGSQQSGLDINFKAKSNKE